MARKRRKSRKKSYKNYRKMRDPLTNLLKLPLAERFTVSTSKNNNKSHKKKKQPNPYKQYKALKAKINKKYMDLQKYNPAYNNPLSNEIRRIKVCTKRKVRKEIIHALNRAGKGKGNKKPRYTNESNIRCK